MLKASLTPLLLAIACLLAGLYGVLHNQISYTVSYEYFTEFKNNVAFARTGTMHNFSYLGGVLGIVSGVVCVLRERRKAWSQDSLRASQQAERAP